MNAKEFLEKVCNEIRYKPIQNEISEELKNHIEDIKNEQLQKGIEENKAEEIAVKQMGEPSEIGKKLNKIHKPKLDWKLILIAGILLIFGIIVSIIKTQNNVTVNDNTNYIIKNIVHIIIGLIISLCIYFLNYKKLSKYSNYIYLLATIIVIFGLWGSWGTPVNGKIHLKILNIIIALEHVCVPLYIIAFAGFLKNYDKNKTISISDITIKTDLIKIIILSMVSVYLILVIPATVYAIVLLTTYLILGTIEILRNKETKKKNLTLLCGLIFLIMISIIIYIVIQEPYRFDRLIASFNPDIDPQGGGWIVIQQRTILKSAKLIGEAEYLGNAIGLFNNGDNYALTAIIANYGWLPAIILITTIIVFAGKIIYNSKIIKDDYGKYLIIGLGSLFILESIANILMNLTMGLQIASNLPFVSYGGPDLVVNMICLAMILCVYRRKNI